MYNALRFKAFPKLFQRAVNSIPFSVVNVLFAVLPDEVPRGDGEPGPGVQLHSLQEAVPRVVRRQRNDEPPAQDPFGAGHRQEQRRIRGQGSQGDRLGTCFTYCLEVNILSFVLSKK